MDHQDRLEKVHDFFFQKVGVPPDVQTDGLESYLAQLPSMTSSSIETISAPFCAQEISPAIHNIPTKRSPGSDGLTSEFYKLFALEYSKILLWLHTKSMEETLLPTSLRQAVVSLIFKKGDPEMLGNWRPISLCNVDDKILSTVVKNRIVNLMPSIIGPHQTCNIRQRSIFDNLHFFRDFFDHEHDGAILSLDQEAAFDRVNRGLLFKSMKSMNFPNIIVSTVKLLNERNSVMVRVGSSLTKNIPVNCGVKQGDPIASLLFIITFEIFLTRVKQKITNASGPTNGCSLVTCYADDCHIVISDPSDFDVIEDELKNYGKYSGGKLNRSKTNCLLLGSWKLVPPKCNFPTVTTGTKILGIPFGSQQLSSSHWDSLSSSFQEKLSRKDGQVQQLWSALKSKDPEYLSIIDFMVLNSGPVPSSPVPWKYFQSLYQIPVGKRKALGKGSVRILASRTRVTWSQEPFGPTANFPLSATEEIVDWQFQWIPTPKRGGQDGDTSPRRAGSPQCVLQQHQRAHDAMETTTSLHGCHSSHEMAHIQIIFYTRRSFSSNQP